MPAPVRRMLLGLALIAAPTLAQAKPPSLTAERAAVAQSISDCRKVADGEARLACYDKAADAFEQAQAQGQVVVIDRAKMQEVKRQAFGFSMPSLNFLPHGPKEEPVNRITVVLASVGKDATGKWVMTTQDEAVWKQIDENELFHDPHAGSTVAIRRATLGSYFCNVDGQSAIRCTRTQ